MEPGEGGDPLLGEMSNVKTSFFDQSRIGEC
jgi:hypothetical protein